MQRNKELMFLAEEDLSAPGSRMKRSSWNIKNNLKSGLKRVNRKWKSSESLSRSVCVCQCYFICWHRRPRV